MELFINLLPAMLLLLVMVGACTGGVVLLAAVAHGAIVYIAEMAGDTIEQ